jgi:hypothetical protein
MRALEDHERANGPGNHRYNRNDDGKLATKVDDSDIGLSTDI